MRILRVIGSMNPASGGPCQGIRNSIPELQSLGMTNEVVCLDDPNSFFLTKDIFPVHALGPGMSSWSYSQVLLPWLLENLYRFDIVIVHGLWLYHSFAVQKAIRQYKRKNKGCTLKWYVMPHGMLDPYFQNAPGRRLKAVRNWVYWKLIEKGVVNGADGILFTCEGELQLARKSFRPYRPKTELNIGYGIAAPPPFSSFMANSFHSLCEGLDDQPFILFLSRIHPKKGVDLLLKAYAEVAEAKYTKGERVLLKSGTSTSGTSVKDSLSFPLPKLVVAGPGLDTPFGERMLQLVNESIYLKGSVFFPGMLTGDAKWGAFYSCEAFILPSHQENFGIAVVEALACGKPVLISDQINIWHEVQVAKGGLVAEDSVSGTKKLLWEWLGLDDETKALMNSRALEAYNRNFRVTATSEKLVSLLNMNSQVSTFN